MVKICFIRGFNATTPFEWVLDNKKQLQRNKPGKLKY